MTFFGRCAALFLLLQALLPWTASCSKRASTTIDVKDVQLTKESLEDFTAHLTGGSTDPCAVELPEDLVTWQFNRRHWMKYIVGSVAVLGCLDRCVLIAMHKLWRYASTRHFPQLTGGLVEKNDLDTVAQFIAANIGSDFWDFEIGDFLIGLMGENENSMRPLFEKVLAILRESEGKSSQYGHVLRHTLIGFQYDRLNSGQVPMDEIDKIYLAEKPPHSLLREIFFRARCSSAPNPQIREYIAEVAPWFRQFMPEDIPSSVVDTRASSISELGNDLWSHLRRNLDMETLIFVWPLVCSSWNRSYSKILAEDTRIQEWLLHDLSHVKWRAIHTIAPWNHFLNEANSAAYLGQCIISGALGRAELDHGSKQEVIRYLDVAGWCSSFVPKASKTSTLCESFVRLVEESHKVYKHEIPTLFKPSFLTNKEHEEVIHHLVCQKKLVIRLSRKWLIDNASRIYSILGEDQALIEEVIRLSTHNYREALFLWIMIGQACGMTDDTAKLVFDMPGIFIENFIRPVVIKPSEYYDHIAESGMLFEMLNIYDKTTVYDQSKPASCTKCELEHLMLSLILFFKDRPDKIDKIVASMNSKLSTLNEPTLKWMRVVFGKGALYTVRNSGAPLKDVAFVERVLKRCGLLEKSAA